MKTNVLITVVFLLAIQLAGAQNFSKTGVATMRLRNSGSIIQDNQVKGYYFFYNQEKKDRKNNTYLLSVHDENLREINSVNIVRPVNYVLLDGAFNGEAFAFLFYDTKNRTLEFNAYDRTLAETGKALKKVESQMAQMAFNSVATSGEASQPYLISVSNKGFLFYGVKAGKKYQYEIDFYDNTAKMIWSKAAPENAMNFEAAMDAFQSDNYIGSLVVKKKSATSKDVDTHLLLQDAASGNVLFSSPLATTKYSVTNTEVFFDASKRNFVVFGEYYDIKDKELSSRSLGFIYLTFDMTGKIVGEKTNSWEVEMSRATPMNEKGKFEGNNTNIIFHDIIRTSDGQIFVVGEQYKKVASAGGIIMTAAFGAGAAATSQMNVYNLVIFQFNADYTINKVHIFEKDKNVVTYPAGYGYQSAKMLSYYAKAVGGFDYTFSQQSTDKSTFVVTYVNYDREKGEKGKNLLGSIVYTPEKTFSVDKMPLNRKSTAYFVHRAKEGYVLITEYFRKEKRVDSRLEKINF